MLSLVVTSISANRIMHHAPFIVPSIISVSLVTELISDQSKHALPSKISSCSFFLRILNYPQFLTIFKSSGKSSDDETKVETYRVAKGHKLRRICSQDSYCNGFYTCPADGVSLALMSTLLLIPDSFCAGAKTIQDRASVHTWEQWFLFGAISVTEQNCAAPIPRVESELHIG